MPEGVINAERVSHSNELMKDVSQVNWAGFIARLQIKINEKWANAYPGIPIPTVDFPETYELSHASSLFDFKGLINSPELSVMRQTKTLSQMIRSGSAYHSRRNYLVWGAIETVDGLFYMTYDRGGDDSSKSSLRLVLRFPVSNEGSLSNSSSSSATSNLSASSGKKEIPQN